MREPPRVVYGFPRGTPEGVLSNFHPDRFAFGRFECWHGEGAFQLCKTLDPAERARLAAERDPGRAKALGRRLLLRPDWDVVCTSAMVAVVRARARAGGEFARFLADTGDAVLVEANSWGDLRWGVDARTGRGRNWLGISLMFVRGEIAAERDARTGALDAYPDDAWPRFPAADAPCEDWSPAALRAGRMPSALLDGGTLDISA